MKRGRFEIKYNEGAFGQRHYYWWVYLAANGEIVCQSQMLRSEQACRKGIASVKRGFLNPVIMK